MFSVVRQNHQNYTVISNKGIIQSKIKWDLTNGPLSKLLELLDSQV